MVLMSFSYGYRRVDMCIFLDHDLESIAVKNKFVFFAVEHNVQFQHDFKSNSWQVFSQVK
jgi:hypothetical protein